MRARSHQYLESDNYTDTTFHDKEKSSLDVAYQNFKQFNTAQYPMLSTITILYIDHNKLTSLPFLPNLRELTCSVNCLKAIPFYPNLTFLSMSHNNIVNCNQYHDSQLRYFDCSYNPGFNLDFRLPHCTQLYINNNELISLDMTLVPSLVLLDASFNKLTELRKGSENLTEIDIKNNNISGLPIWPKLEHLAADYNQLSNLQTYPLLTNLDITHNILTQISDQPNLKRINASNNLIKHLGNMPKVKFMDFSYNNLDNITIPQYADHISIQFNQITKLDLGNANYIKNLQIDFRCYKQVYDTYYNKFQSVSIHPDSNKLETLLKKLSNTFKEDLINYIFQKFSKSEFHLRAEMLIDLSLILYKIHFSNNVGSISDTEEYKYLLNTMTKLYYRTIVATFVF